MQLSKETIEDHKKFEGVKSVKHNHQPLIPQDSGRVSNRSSVSSKAGAENNDENKDDDNLDQYRNWRSKKIDTVNKRIFIKECKLSSVRIEISFLARKSVKNLGGKTS